VTFRYAMEMHDIALSIAMIAVFLLAGGGAWLIAKKRDYKRGVLMIIAALVIAGNVAIWTVPIT
jgi:hypothetical protein